MAVYMLIGAITKAGGKVMTWRFRKVWSVLLTTVLFGLILPSLLAQSHPNIEAALAATSSPDLQTRVNAFYALVGPAGTNTNSARGLENLLRSRPEEAERIKVVLIAALEREVIYKETLDKNGQQLSETFTDYWADLMLAVGSLRDPRAINGLLGGVNTGGIAVNALADLCPQSVDALIEKTREPNHYFQGNAFNLRAGAVKVLGMCVKRVESMHSNLEAMAKARNAILAALDDPDWNVRDASVNALFVFRHDADVRAKLQIVEATDTHASVPSVEGIARFTVRDSAARVLGAK